MSDVSQANPSSAAGEEWLAVDDYQPMGAAGGVVLVGATRGGQILSQPEVEMSLQHCRVFRTLEGHARHLVQVLPQLGGNIDDARRVLQLVYDAGLFVSAEDICERINRQSSEASADLDQPKACVITCDRPPAVQRLLETMLRSAKLSRMKRFYLIDDSRDPANAAANRDAVEQFNLVSPTSMNYIGDAEQRRLIVALQDALPEHSAAVSFLLDRTRWGDDVPSYGRARTLALLLTVGDRCIVMDDDVLCLALRAAEPEPGLAFSDGQTDTVFYPTAEQWQQDWQPTDFDPLAGHARCLGMALAEAMRELGVERIAPSRLAGVSPGLFGDVDGSAPLLVTQSGTVGDPGTSDNAWLPYLKRDTVTRMLNQGGLDRALTTRECWLGFAQATVSRRAVMSQITGLDNRVALPPYFPVLRGEDHLFGALVEFLFPDSLALEYDWAVPHLPLEPRPGNPEGDSVVPRGGLKMLSSYLSEAAPVDAGVDYSTRLQLAAARFSGLGKLSDQELLARFRQGLSRAQVFALQTLNDRLVDSGALDPQWRQYLETNARQCIAALAQPADFSVLDGVSDNTDVAAVATRIRKAAAGFGYALLAWPEIRRAAADYLSHQAL